jgi:hypothetical protein
LAVSEVGGDAFFLRCQRPQNASNSVLPPAHETAPYLRVGADRPYLNPDRRAPASRALIFLEDQAKKVQQKVCLIKPVLKPIFKQKDVL